MPNRSGFDLFSRRAFLAGLAGAGVAAAGARAQSPIDTIINAPERGNWDDQFDANASRAAARVSSNVPVLSQDTAANVQFAIFDYQQIVANGGWPTVPAGTKLELGLVDPAVVPLRERLMVSGDLPREAGLSRSFDTYVQGAVKRFQARHGLPADGVVGTHTLQALNVPAPIRLAQLETNLVRLNSMSGPLGRRYVMVNIPAAAIEAVEDGRVVRRHTAIVGKIDRQTPILSSQIHEIILNPTWTAPRSIVQKDIMPVMREDPTYLTRNNIRLFDGQGNEVDPATIDWHAAEAPDLTFRQDPGKINAMASTKINFPNPHAVYMHDTPQQSLFGQLERFESSGCVRVQNVRDLTTWLLEGTPEWSRQRMERTIATGQTTPVALGDPVPVYFTYITAWSTADRIVQFREDIYHRDGASELAFVE